MVKNSNSNSARASNTLAENTEKNGLKACIDWLSCSFESRCNIEQVFNLMGISDLSTLELVRGARYEFAGYDKTFRLGKIEVMHYEDQYNGMDNWLINMSGQACRQFEISSTFDFPTLFGVLANVNAVYTRLDVAIDDFNNIYTVNQFRNAVYNKQCVTRLKDWGDHRRGKISTGLDDVTMNNFYLGSSTSRYFINVYDKKLEREAKGIEIDVKSWVRTEVRFRYDYADAFIVSVLLNKDDIGYHIRSFLNSNIVFLKPSALLKDSNRSRLAKDIKNHAEWWRSFLHNSGKLKLSSYKPEKTLNDSKQWVLNQVAVTLALLHEYNPHGFSSFIDLVVERGLNNMQKKHLRKLHNQQYLDKQIVSFGDYIEKVETYEEVPRRMKNKAQIMDVYWKQVEEQEKNLLHTQDETDSFAQ